MTGAALSKAHVVAAVIAAITEQCASVERVAAMARDEASGDESRSEGQYDTRATEASYLARGQAERWGVLRQSRSWFESVGAAPCDHAEAGALLRVRVRGGEEWLYLAPVGSPSVVVDGQVVRIVAVESPLGAALADAVAGDEVEVDGPLGGGEWLVLGVS